jgi:WD40 repeat protein
MLFSCSNDKTVNICKLGDYGNVQIHQYHSDYIKSLCYNDNTNTLFTAGYDGVINAFSIEEYTKQGIIRSDPMIYGLKDLSVYSISCDNSGNLLLASFYENVYYFDIEYYMY